MFFFPSIRNRAKWQNFKYLLTVMKYTFSFFRFPLSMGKADKVRMLVITGSAVQEDMVVKVSPSIL